MSTPTRTEVVLLLALLVVTALIVGFIAGLALA